MKAFYSWHPLLILFVVMFFDFTGMKYRNIMLATNYIIFIYYIH